jgi:hypothetical protein
MTIMPPLFAEYQSAGTVDTGELAQLIADVIATYGDSPARLALMTAEVRELYESGHEEAPTLEQPRAYATGDRLISLFVADVARRAYAGLSMDEVRAVHGLNPDDAARADAEAKMAELAAREDEAYLEGMGDLGSPPMDGGFGSPPSTGGLGTPPSAGGSGGAPSDAGRPLSGGGLGIPPSGGGFGSPPSGGGFGRPASGGSLPSDAESPPSAGGFGSPPPSTGGAFEGPATVSNADAMQRMLAPAIACMVYGGIGVAWQLLTLILNIIGVGMGSMEQVASDSPVPEGLVGGAIGALSAVLGLVVGGVVLYGGLQMKDLQRYPLCIAAAIGCMVPCVNPCCCIIGLGPGIWSLVMLLKPEIKAQFSS